MEFFGKPLGDRVLVAKDAAKDTSEGGIIIPEAQNDSPVSYGTVKAVSDRNKSGVKSGDRVVFNRYAGVIVGSNFLFLREDEVLGIVD